MRIDGAKTYEILENLDAAIDITEQVAGRISGYFQQDTKDQMVLDIKDAIMCLEWAMHLIEGTVPARKEKEILKPQPESKEPWLDEPNFLKFVTDVGLRAVIKRNGVGALCGYVVIPKDHKIHGMDYSNWEIFPDFNVHGGITFSGPIKAEGVPEDDWFIGFDCAHSGDFCPDMPHFGRASFNDGAKYRTIEYVKEECERLAVQVLLLNNN